MIELESLTKRYADITAVENLSLSIQAGEIFGFIGPNGAGKTTTIKMLGGILAPTSGRVRICGIDMAVQPEDAKRKIGFIPDRPYLYEKLTAMEFLLFTAELYGIGRNGFRRRAQTELDRFSLSEWSGELIESFSHGMKQRLVMAAALLIEPAVIVVDEPMVGLDPIAIKMVKDLFLDLAQNGTTVFMSTHTLQVAQDLCHRIGVIHRGKLIATGSPGQLMKLARTTEADLEAVFIRLTEEDQMGIGGRRNG
jgi:ABC-2 type transport system ATP-binding protein